MRGARLGFALGAPLLLLLYGGHVTMRGAGLCPPAPTQAWPVQESTQRGTGAPEAAGTRTQGLRYLKPEMIDFVVADPLKSNAEALASALGWTRVREKTMYEQLNNVRHELESLQMQAANRHRMSNASKRHGAAARETFCRLPGSDLRILTAPDGKFEGTGKTKRLDGIVQTFPIQDKFGVLLCVHEQGTSGVVRIHKRMHCNEHVAFTKDAEYESLIRQRFGPDEFILNLEGPELHGLNANLQYRGNCTYDLPFEVSTAGLYHVNLVWCRENYVGAREGVLGWLPDHLDKPLGERCFVRLGNTKYSEEVLRRHLKRQKTVCDLRSSNYTYMRGRWVFQGSNASKIFHAGPVPLYHRHVGDSRMHTWVRLEEYAWMPTSCDLPKMSAKGAMHCLQGKRILFEGDSHMRMLYNALLTYVCGPQKEWSGFDSQCGRACKQGHMQNVCMKKDGTAARESFANASMDLTIINFGQHFSAGYAHKTFREYQLRVDQLATKIKSLSPAQRRTIVWHETNMMPLRKDMWIQSYGDQRTNTKIAAYNLYASAEMQKLGVPIIPSFIQTLPLFAGSHDDAHIPVPYLTQSSLTYVLALACLG